MLTEFIKSVGGCTPAASILNVSGTILHKWKKTGLSKKATVRVALWMAYNVSRERFILRNIWAKEDNIWSPDENEYKLWLVHEFNCLQELVGLERSSALWTELHK